MHGNTSEISSWTAAAISYAIAGSAPSRTDLQYICTNFDTLTSRYATSFASSYGDVLAFSKSAICSAANNQRDPLHPAGDDPFITPLWFMKTFLAGTFTLQAYAGDAKNTSYFADMCWLLEDSLLVGLWAPGPDVNGSGVDVESSFCASAGGYAKGEYTKYTDEPVNKEVEAQAGRLVSEVVARGVKMVASSDEQVKTICEKLGEWGEGIKKMTLDPDVIEKVMCEKKEALPAEKASAEFLGAMSRLFTFQLLNAGNYPGLPEVSYPSHRQFLCENLKEDSLNAVKLDGEVIKKEACAAAAAKPNTI